MYVDKFFIKNILQGFYISSGMAKNIFDFFLINFIKIEISILKSSFVYQLVSAFFVYLLSGFVGNLNFKKESTRTNRISTKLNGCCLNIKKHLWHLLNLVTVFGNNKTISYNSVRLISKQGFCFKYIKPYYLNSLWLFNAKFYNLLNLISNNLIIIIYLKFLKKTTSKFFFKLLL